MNSTWDGSNWAWTEVTHSLGFESEFSLLTMALMVAGFGNPRCRATCSCGWVSRWKTYRNAEQYDAAVKVTDRLGQLHVMDAPRVWRGRIA